LEDLATVFSLLERPLSPCAVVECFLKLLKRERMIRWVNATQHKARQDAFNYIVNFRNRIRKQARWVYLMIAAFNQLYLT